jgi:pectate lyase
MFGKAIFHFLYRGVSITPLYLFFMPILLQAQIAFPGAEGFGKFTTGGRGGAVITVTNLNDAGAGSFREAVTKKGKRIIVFAVSGTIHLETNLSIAGDVTIAGQTAPGEGICLADRPVTLGGNNIIVRYLRFRMGDKYQRGGMVDGNGGDDAFGGTKRKNIIVDHCSMSWSTDEVFSIYNGDSTTIQWNLIAEPLNYSYHFETGDKDYEHHGYGGIWGGTHLSAHHNLFAHCISRTPRFNGARLGASIELVDFRNNVIYNWGHNNVYGGEGGSYNVVANYYKSGPGTSKQVNSRILNPSKTDKIGFGNFYVADNYMHGNDQVTANNKMGVQFDKDITEAQRVGVLIDNPFLVEALPIESAIDAYTAILVGVGASYKRDTLDARILKEVVEMKGKYIDVQGGYPHGTTYEKTISAWPTLKMGLLKLDTDGDGMPDEWEISKGLNYKDASDASLIAHGTCYTNIELYINSIVK